MSVGFVYFIGASDPFSPIKVGWAGRDPKKRLKDLQVGNPNALRLYAAFPAETRGFEGECQKVIRHARVKGEWFHRDEAFRLKDFLEANDRLPTEEEENERCLQHIQDTYEERMARLP